MLPIPPFAGGGGNQSLGPFTFWDKLLLILFPVILMQWFMGGTLLIMDGLGLKFLSWFLATGGSTVAYVPVIIAVLAPGRTSSGKIALVFDVMVVGGLVLFVLGMVMKGAFYLGFLK